MPWFSVSCYSKRRSQPGSETLYEESVFLVWAVNSEDAIESATNLTRAEQVQYRSNSGDWVEWEFHAVGTAYELLSDPEEGVEVFGRFLTEEAVSAILDHHTDEPGQQE